MTRAQLATSRTNAVFGPATPPPTPFHASACTGDSMASLSSAAAPACSTARVGGMGIVRTSGPTRQHAEVRPPGTATRCPSNAACSRPRCQLSSSTAVIVRSATRRPATCCRPGRHHEAAGRTHRTRRSDGRAAVPPRRVLRAAPSRWPRAVRPRAGQLLRGVRRPVLARGLRPGPHRRRLAGAPRPIVMVDAITMAAPVRRETKISRGARRAGPRRRPALLAGDRRRRKTGSPRFAAPRRRQPLTIPTSPRP